MKGWSFDHPWPRCTGSRVCTALLHWGNPRKVFVENEKSENLITMQWQAVEAEKESARSKLVVDKKSARGQTLGGTRCSHVLQSQTKKLFYGPSKFKTFE